MAQTNKNEKEANFMGLLGSFGKLGAKGAAKELDDKRQNRIQSYAQSDIIRFAKTYSSDPELQAELLRFENLPETYFDIPEDPKLQKILYEMVSLLAAKPEQIQKVSGGVTYFVIAHSITGSATNGMIAYEGGILDGRGALTKHIPRDEIAAFEKDKKDWIYIVTKSGDTKWLTSTDSKVIRREADKYLELFRRLYC